MLGGSSLEISRGMNSDELWPHGAAHQTSVDTRGKKRASRGIGRAAALDPSGCAIVRQPEKKSDEKEEANPHDDMTTVCETAAPPCQRRIRSAQSRLGGSIVQRVQR